MDKRNHLPLLRKTQPQLSTTRTASNTSWKVRISWFTIVVYPLLCCSGPVVQHAASTANTIQRGNKMPPAATLTVQVAGNKVIVHIKIDNRSDQVLYIEKSKIVAVPPVRTKLFRIVCEEKDVPYIGPMAKKKPPTRDDFFSVAPGADIQGFADITDLYAFLPGTHSYTIQYKTFQGDPDDEAKLNEIDSEPTSFVLRR